MQESMPRAVTDGTTIDVEVVKVTEETIYIFCASGSRDTR